jgi:hypothetical protein
MKNSLTNVLYMYVYSTEQTHKNQGGAWEDLKTSLHLFLSMNLQYSKIQYM